MKKQHNLFVYAIFFLLTTFVLAGCASSSDDDDDDNNRPLPSEGPTKDIVDTAIDAGDFEYLVTALQAAGLVDALRGPGPFTVFAPTDAAFEAIPEDVLNALLNDPNTAALKDILKYHVFDGEVQAADALALDGQSVGMLNGDLLRLDVVGEDLILNDAGLAPATVIATDILTTNGVIHVIDAVVMPSDGKSNIVDTLVNLGNFTTLVTAVQVAGLESVLADPDATFTLFAPTDEAFGKIPDDVINALLADTDTLQDVLTYHAIAGAEVYAVDALDAAQGGAEVQMVNGDPITLDIVGSDLVINADGDSPAVVTVTDYISTNGVIHVIDTVISPADSPDE